MNRPLFASLLWGWLYSLLLIGCQEVSEPVVTLAPTAVGVVPTPMLTPEAERKTTTDATLPAVAIPPTATVAATGTGTASAAPVVTLDPVNLSSFDVYYVATDGSDSLGDGSLDSPWATISWASDHVPDGSTILVQPGDYFGYVNLRSRFDKGVLISSAVPYQARLRNDQKPINCHLCRGITLEGFDIAHDGPGAGRYVIQIQDEEGLGRGGRDFILRNNIIHDSYNNDLVKVNNGADQVTIEGNIFYNQNGSDSHIDINGATNVTVQDNIFLNNFAGSGRTNNNDTGSYIVVKDSDAGDDQNIGSANIVIRRNILLNWEGLSSNTFIVIGEDSVDYYQAYDVLIENNLFLGNSSNLSRGAFGVKGSRDIIFRHNTIVGDLPAKAYAMRLNLQKNNLINRDIEFYNNIWSDPTGTMGSEGPDTPNDFSDTLPEETESFVLLNNLYWNGGVVIPVDRGDLINFTDDPLAVLGNPGLPKQEGMVLPHWDEEEGRFTDKSSTIREAFNRLVLLYGALASNSPAIDRANPSFSPTEDILGTPRQSGLPDIGAYEYPLP